MKLFYALGACSFAKVDLAAVPAVNAHFERVGARPSVHPAQAAERTAKAA